MLLKSMSEIKRPVPGGQREDRKERGIKGCAQMSGVPTIGFDKITKN